MAPLTSRIAIGTVQFGLDYGISNNTGVVSPAEVSRLLAAASHFGIDTIDTARVYGNSESVLGKSGIDSLKVISKFMPNPDEPVWVSLKKSLEDLRLDSLYGYLSHSGEFLISHPKVWLEMQELKKTGKVKKTGYSLYLPDHLKQLLERNMVPDIIQVQYNLFDRRFEPYFSKLKELGTEIHTRSCFLQGLFFLHTIDPFFKILEAPLQNLKNLFPDLGKRAAALMRFCLDNHAVDKIVIGVRSKEELIANLQELNAIPEGCLKDFKLPDCDNDILLPYNWPRKP
jgi:aryl-alcohol dehydrogenase-like predicted oxidoreductase